MRATPLSKKQYFPMLLSNGRNAALVDYGGSMLSAITGHAHFTQHQNAACGWYKVANSWKGKLKVIEKVAACGYQVILNGEFCEPIHFVQRFNPKKAILKTEVLFFLNIRLVIESFMTDDDILVENYKFIFIPDNCKLDFTTVVLDPSKILIGPSLPESSSKISSWKSETDISQRAMRFSYQIDEISGYGEMYSDTTVNALGGWGDAGFEFQNLKSGGGMTRFVCISDSSEKTDYQNFVLDKIADCKKHGYKKIRSEHIGVWNGYFEQSSITIPDKESEYLYNLSRYMMRANLHPETGGLTVGMLPYIYGGGTYVPYDAWYMHQALLLTNNTQEAAKHLDYYQMQYETGKELALQFGLKGATFSGWASCYGEHKDDNIKHYLLFLKPMMVGFITLIIYWQWKYTGKLSERQKEMLKDSLKFIITSSIVDKGDIAEVVPCKSGSESAAEVKNDTFTALAFARALKGAFEIFGSTEYEKLSDKLYNGLRKNYCNDVLMPYHDAWYLTGLQIWFYILNLPDGIPAEYFEKLLDDMKTPKGYTAIQPTEYALDWPWMAARGAICMSHLKNPKKAFELLLHQKKHTSSLGALPEKIRIDGYPLLYWYSTPHGLFIWSLCVALAHIDKNNCVNLLYGLDGQWKKLSFKNLRLPGEILVSVKIENKEVSLIELVNSSSKIIETGLDINPVYGDGPGMSTKQITLGAGEKYSWEARHVD